MEEREILVKELKKNFKNKEEKGSARYWNPERINRKRKREADRRVFTVSEMSEKYHEIARLLVLGLSRGDIAKRVGCSITLVSNVKNSPIVQEKLEFLRAGRDGEILDIMQQIKESLPQCVKYLRETIDNENIADSTKSKNAFGLLGLGGYSPVKNINFRGAYAVLDKEDIEDIKERSTDIEAEIIDGTKYIEAE